MGGAETRAKEALVVEALSWVGTPFRDCSDIKGPNGAVDCAMLLTRCTVDTGLLPPFDPRPYAPRLMMNSDEQLFLKWIVDRLGGREVETPRFGDIAVWQFGKSFSHGGIVINNDEVVHAYAKAGTCMVSPFKDRFLSKFTLRGIERPRPVRFFDIWKG